MNVSLWSERSDVCRGAAYDQRWTALQATGKSIHGEADLVAQLLEDFGRGPEPQVLDAGCGTGRVAIELDRRGIATVGVDLDPAMLTEAKRKAAHLRWLEADLCDLDIEQCFDLVVLAGNVLIFLKPGSEAAVLRNMARHLQPGGLLLAGFQLHRLSLADYDRYANTAGLTLVDRWATWGKDRYRDGDYAVSLHQINNSSKTPTKMP